MIIDRIKELLAYGKLKQVDLARLEGCSPQQVHIRFMRGTFPTRDLIKYAKYTNTRLAFIDEDNKPVVIFRPEDIEKAD